MTTRLPELHRSHRRTHTSLQVASRPLCSRGTRGGLLERPAKRVDVGHCYPRLVERCASLGASGFWHGRLGTDPPSPLRTRSHSSLKPSSRSPSLRQLAWASICTRFGSAHEVGSFTPRMPLEGRQGLSILGHLMVGIWPNAAGCRPADGQRNSGRSSVGGRIGAVVPVGRQMANCWSETGQYLAT
jgi:hypothetical protein